MHTRDEALVMELVRYANGRWGKAWLREAAEVFFEDSDDGPEGVHLQLFMPWVVHHWEIEGRPVREWFLEERGERLAEQERAWLLAQRCVVVSIWEVLEVEEGVGLRVKDMLGGGGEHFAQEVRGSRQLVVRDAVLGRLVEFEGGVVFCGMYPRPLPPAEVDEVVRTARQGLPTRSARPVSHEKLAREDTTLGLVLLWRDAVDWLEEKAERPLRLCNTDGEPIVLVVDVYRLEPSTRPLLLERLASLEGAEEEAPEEAGPGPVAFSFLKEGNAMHASWENTIIGSATVETGTLRLSSNSVRRADALRHRVEAACPGLVIHVSRERGGALTPRGGPPPPAAPPPTPEQLEALRDFKARHYRDWLDVRLPVLDGKSPRQAVRSAAGRRRVEVLLKEIENREARLPPGEQVDTLGLRRDLGMELDQ